MRWRRWVAAAVAMTGLTACANQPGSTAGRDQPSASAAAPSAMATDSSPGLPAPVFSATSQPALPDDEKAQEAWLRAMWAYDRLLVSDGPTALDYADQLCLDLRKDTSGVRAERDAAKLFQVDVTRAKKIIKITKSTRCPAV